MATTDTNILIFQVIDKITNFLIRDNQIGKNFREFSQTEFKNVPQDELRSRTLTYLFSRKIGQKTVFDFYREKNTNLSAEEYKIIRAIENAFVGVFEIKKLFQDGFELYSIINERTYTVKTIGARTNYRGAYVGAYLFCCLCKADDVYYICDSRAITGSDKAGGAQRYAISKILENPNLVYYDNPEKLEEIKEEVEYFDKKFQECFNSYEVVTTNKYADVIINAYNDYCENGGDEIKTIIEKGIPQPQSYKYFTTKDFTFSSPDDVKQKSMAGFSAEENEYDVGIIFVKGSGFYAIPFYATFCKIFELENYQQVENYEDCLNNFLRNDKIPRSVIKFVADKYPNFMPRMNEIMHQNNTFESLMDRFKPKDAENQQFSTAVILYSSKVFASLMEKEEKKSSNVQKVGRNAPCPCGSGKKYKKCCMPKNE